MITVNIFSSSCGSLWCPPEEKEAKSKSMTASQPELVLYLSRVGVVAKKNDYSYLMFDKIGFHDKYRWELWKNRAVKSAGVGAKYKCWPPIAQSETPGLLFFENLFNEGRYISQSTKSFHLLCLSGKEGKYSCDVATGICFLALEPNSIWQIMNGLKFVSHTNFSVPLELWLTFTTFRWKILR